MYFYSFEKAKEVKEISNILIEELNEGIEGLVEVLYGETQSKLELAQIRLIKLLKENKELFDIIQKYNITEEKFNDIITRSYGSAMGLEVNGYIVMILTFSNPDTLEFLLENYNEFMTYEGLLDIGAQMVEYYMENSMFILRYDDYTRDSIMQRLKPILLFLEDITLNDMDSYFTEDNINDFIDITWIASGYFEMIFGTITGTYKEDFYIKSMCFTKEILTIDEPLDMELDDFYLIDEIARNSFYLGLLSYLVFIPHSTSRYITDEQDFYENIFDTWKVLYSNPYKIIKSYESAKRKKLARIFNEYYIKYKGYHITLANKFNFNKTKNIKTYNLFLRTFYSGVIYGLCYDGKTEE